jgi:hypothetical protein
VLWPYIVVLAVLALLMLVSVRNRKRAVADDLVRVSRIGVGTEVMWAAAALRDAPSLSEDYRRALDESHTESDGDGVELRKSDDGP